LSSRYFGIVCLLVSWSAPVEALHLVSGAGRLFSTSCRYAIASVSRQRSERREHLDRGGQVGVGGETIEVRVVVEDRRAVVLGDRGGEVVERADAEVLVRRAKLLLQLDRSAFGTRSSASGTPAGTLERQACAATLTWSPASGTGDLNGVQWPLRKYRNRAGRRCAAPPASRSARRRGGDDAHPDG